MTKDTPEGFEDRLRSLQNPAFLEMLQNKPGTDTLRKVGGEVEAAMELGIEPEIGPEVLEAINKAIDSRPNTDQV